MNRHQQARPPHIITVFFDSLCPICRREVALYQTLDKPQKISWVDLRTTTDQQLREQWGFTLADAMALLHVQDAQGQLHIGLAGHIAMWAQLPFYRILAALLSRHPRLAQHCNNAYQVFTRWRPGRFRTVQSPADVRLPCRSCNEGSDTTGAQL